MFGTTPNEIVDSGGVAPDPATVPARAAPSFFENFTQAAVGGAMGHASELGAVYQGQRFLTDQTNAIRTHDPEFADKLKNHYGALPDVESGMFSGNPQIGTWAAHLAGADPQQDLVDTIESQHKIEDWKKLHPEITDVPSINSGIAQVKNQQDIVDKEAEEAQQRSAGINIPGIGKVSGAGLLGGIAASFAPSNPSQAIFNIALAGTGGISKDLIAGTGARIASNAAANGVVSAVSQSVLAAPQAEQYGVQRDYKQEAFGVLANTLLGGMISGAHEIGEHYFPATTAKAMQEVKGAVDGAVKKTGEVSDALKEVAAAHTPDEANAIVAGMPLETKLDVLHEVSPNPSAEERGVMQAGEKELVIEKAGKQAGMEYPETAQHVVEVAKAIESGRKIPETNEQKNVDFTSLPPSEQQEPTLPPSLAGAKTNYNYGPTKPFTLNFDSDVDKALYIVSSSGSKADARYRDFLQKNGFSDADIQEQGKAIRDKIKGMAKNGEPGELKIEKTNELKQKPVQATTKEAPTIKYPVQTLLKRKGGVKVGSNLDAELRSMGINPKTAPGLFKTMGKLTDVDNFPHSEWDLSSAPKDETGNYVDRQYILDALQSERAGRPITRQEISPETGRIAPGSKDDLERYAQEHGVDTEGKSVDEAIAEIRQHEADLEAAKHEQEEIDTVGAREESQDKELEAKYHAIEQRVMPTEGEQHVIPGTEKIGDKDLAERKMEEPLKSGKPQKEANEGLFDTGARQQQELFKDLKPEDAAPISDEKDMTVKDAIDDIKEHEGLLKAMTTCFLG